VPVGFAWYVTNVDGSAAPLLLWPVSEVPPLPALHPSSLDGSGWPIAPSLSRSEIVGVNVTGRRARNFAPRGPAVRGHTATRHADHSSALLIGFRLSYVLYVVCELNPYFLPVKGTFVYPWFCMRIKLYLYMWH
jgi:hypothetical protein